MCLNSKYIPDFPRVSTVNGLNLSETATLKKTKIGFQDQLSLMQVKSIAECSEGNNLQYFRPSLSYQLLLRSLFCLFLMAVLHRFYCILNPCTAALYL